MRGYKTISLIGILLVTNLCFVFGQGKIELAKYERELPFAGLKHYHITGDELFQAPQNIHLISIPLDLLSTKYQLKLAWSDSMLYPTSTFAEQSQAILGVNAGFFNIANGGSVTFLEYDGLRVSKRSWRGDTPDGQNTNFNGALVRLNSGKISIERARKSDEYLSSDLEKWILISGPLLIFNSHKTELLKGSFVDKAHPRTAIGITNDTLIMLSVDGRHSMANGMNLRELQDFMIALGCTQAINLDGGGSTTMCINKGSNIEVINCPSDNGKFDNKGERKVANALLLLSN